MERLRGRMLYKEHKVRIKDRLAGITANVDDLQAGVEASSRAADAMLQESRTIKSSVKLISLALESMKALVRHAVLLRSCSRDQCVVLVELRKGVVQLQKDLERGIREIALRAKT